MHSSSIPARLPTSPAAGLRLAALALGMFAIGTDSYVVAGILPKVAASFDVSVASAGQLVTVYSLTYAVLTPVLATLTAHWPRRRVLCCGLVVFVAGNLLTGTQTDFSLALVSRAVAGLGAAMFSPAAGATAAALVPPERRARALAIVLAGLSGATALGAPVGTLVASIGSWRSTMWLVSVIGGAAVIGVLVLLPTVPAPQVPRLRERFAPLGDARVAVTLATTLLAMFGVFLIYTYISIVFDRATGGDGGQLAALLSIWGCAATAGNLAAGHLTDRFGSRRVINVALAFATVDFLAMPWTSGTFAGAAIALLVWGMCGWGLVVAQQHRLIAIAPALAPVLLALNASAIYIAVAGSGVLGALAIGLVDPHWLPLLSAGLLASALAMAELAHGLLRSARSCGDATYEVEWGSDTSYKLSSESRAD